MDVVLLGAHIIFAADGPWATLGPPVIERYLVVQGACVAINAMGGERWGGRVGGGGNGPGAGARPAPAALCKRPTLSPPPQNAAPDPAPPPPPPPPSPAGACYINANSLAPNIFQIYGTTGGRERCGGHLRRPLRAPSPPATPSHTRTTLTAELPLSQSPRLSLPHPLAL